MKPIKAIGLLFLLSYLPIYATEESIEEVTTTEEVIVEKVPVSKDAQPKDNSKTEPTYEETIQKLIEKVKDAPDNEKRILMNQIKTLLKNMQQESREQAMIELKKSFDNKKVHIQREQHIHEVQIHDLHKHENHQPKFRHLRQGQR